MAVLSLVQLKVVERRPLLVVRVIVLIGTSEQTVCETGVATATGSGLTMTVAVMLLPTQPL